MMIQTERRIISWWLNRSFEKKVSFLVGTKDNNDNLLGNSKNAEYANKSSTSDDISTMMQSCKSQWRKCKDY